MLRSSTAPPAGRRAGPAPLPGERGGPVPGRRLVLERRQGRVPVHRRDAQVEPERLGLGGEAPLGERGLEAAVLVQQVGGRLRPHAARTRDPVGGVAAERDEVGHLRGLDAVALAHLVRADPRERAAAALRLEHRRPVADELEGVTVAARDQRASSPRLLERDACGEKVVRLVPLRLRGGEPHRLDELRRQVELLEQVVVELAPALVDGQRLVPVGRNRERVPADERRARLLLLPEPDEQVADAGEEAGRAAVRPADRLRQRVVRPVRERVPVDDQERSVFLHADSSSSPIAAISRSVATCAASSRPARSSRGIGGP